MSHGVFVETVSWEDRAAGAQDLRLNSLGGVERTAKKWM